jgi:hypothetical protein
MEKDIQVSVDKLCIVANFKNIYKNVYRFLEFKSFLEQYQYQGNFNFISIKDSYYYNYSYMINDNECFLQYHDERYCLRLEFNPNKINDLTREIIKGIFNYCEDFHLTRLDIACDLYNYDLSSYNITTLRNLKKAYYYDRVGNLETVYIGSLSSNRFFRIYNKALEQHQVGDWWRVELQLRDVYIDMFLNTYRDFFNDVLIYKYEPINNINFNTKATLEYLLNDMTRFCEADKRTRSKYRKIIKSLELKSMAFINDIVMLSRDKLHNTILEYVVI